jgi:hypothetical protein
MSIKKHLNFDSLRQAFSDLLYQTDDPRQKTQACRYLVKNSGTSKSPEFTRQRDRLKAASVLFPARLL